MAEAAFGSGFQFPSPDSITSPDRNWQLVCKSPVTNEAGSGHLLILRKVAGESLEIRRFYRSCDVLWSPDSAHVALTDRLGSDGSDVFIYSVANLLWVNSVSHLIPKNDLSKEELKGHCYIEANGWSDSHRLRIKISGHTDELHSRSFEYRYVLDVLSGRLERIKPAKANRL